MSSPSRGSAVAGGCRSDRPVAVVVVVVARCRCLVLEAAVAAVAVVALLRCLVLEVVVGLGVRLKMVEEAVEEHSRTEGEEAAGRSMMVTEAPAGLPGP